ncbi:hypothetical protein Cni_G01176 [Canna indica]|uniref:Uncharacterized protein n=1 Tax=Canna indica TaxID=4628 RepID=A0AAQ3Q0P5_9LILI|nr:hypothetical protein Cni_G01176 [Canna indica]
MFKYLGRLLSWKSKGGRDLLCRVCLVSIPANAESRISFVKFFVDVAPAMLVGVVINMAILLCMFWNQLSPPKDGEEQGKELEAAVTEDEVISHTFSPARMSHQSPLHPQLSPLNPQRTPANDVEKNMSQSNRAKRGCAHVFGMKSCLTKELFLKGFV